MVDSLEIVVITGMSGAGKTVAMQSFEDMGYYCVDNMPPSLLPKFWELIHESGKENKVALVMDLRGGDFFEDIEKSVEALKNTSYVTTRIVYLDASDEELVSRYKETRRSHPMAPEGRVLEGIQKERALLKEIRIRAQLIIDTTSLTPRQLREQMTLEFNEADKPLFRVQLVSFGFKYGMPIDADIVMDVRFLPNPFYIDELRPLTGQDEAVYDYVMRQPETEPFYHKFTDLLEYCLPGYKREGKHTVMIAVGCTGGKHRSVALVERIARKLESDGYYTHITHRDNMRVKESVNRS